jgi:hypothetical protein
MHCARMWSRITSDKAIGQGQNRARERERKKQTIAEDDGEKHCCGKALALDHQMFCSKERRGDEHEVTSLPECCSRTCACTELVGKLDNVRVMTHGVDVDEGRSIRLHTQRACQ